MIKTLLKISSLIPLFFGSVSFADKIAWNLGSGAAYDQTPHRVVVDAQNDILVVGTFFDSLDFNPNDSVLPLSNPYGPNQNRALFISKFDINGKALWSKQFGGGPIDIYPAENIAQDSAARIFIAGGYSTVSAPLDFGGGPLPNSEARSFVAAFDMDGKFLWSQSLPNTLIESIAADDQGYLYIGGTSQGNLGLNCDEPIQDFSKPIGADPILIRLEVDHSPTPQCSWMQHWPVDSESVSSVKKIRVDSDDNVTVAGNWAGSAATINLGGQTFTASGVIGNSNIFFASFTQKGEHRWSQTFEGSGSLDVNDLAVDEYGNSFIAGSIFGSFNFGGIYIDSISQGSESTDGFIVKFDRDGNAAWLRKFGDGQASTNTQTIQGIAIDDFNQNILVTGHCQGSIIHDSSPITPGNSGSNGNALSCNANNRDIFIERIDKKGNSITAAIFDSFWEEGTSIAHSWNSNRVILAGTFSNTLDLGLGGLIGISFDDAFIAAFDNPKLQFKSKPSIQRESILNPTKR